MVNGVVPAVPNVDVAVMVTVPSAVAVATDELAAKVAIPVPGVADHVTALVRFCVEPSV